MEFSVGFDELLNDDFDEVWSSQQKQSAANRERVQQLENICTALDGWSFHITLAGFVYLTELVLFPTPRVYEEGDWTTEWRSSALCTVLATDLTTSNLIIYGRRTIDSQQKR